MGHSNKGRIRDVLKSALGLIAIFVGIYALGLLAYGGLLA